MAWFGLIYSPTMTTIATSLALLAQIATAHGDMGGEYGGHEDAPGQGRNGSSPVPEPDYPLTYFALIDGHDIIYAHITLMFAFIAINGLGVFLAVVYNAQTPDLYPNNAHHKIGWIATSVMLAQVLIHLVGRLAGTVVGRYHLKQNQTHAYNPIPFGECQLSLSGQSQDEGADRLSNDNGQDTEPGTESSRSSSLSTSDSEEHLHRDEEKHLYENEIDEADNVGSMSLPFLPSNTVASKAMYIVSSWTWKYLDLLYSAIDRTILLFGFVALTTGIVVFGRFFENQAIYSGLAHWVKGGVFFWFGLFTLGRWTGSFADVGWAWNLRPVIRKQTRWCPSAEFVESGLIFFYGSTNIFLEHLGSWGDEWSSQDLEHLSITILFIGGGLCGMLIESSTIRTLLNTTALATVPQEISNEEAMEKWQTPETYKFSINPIPALVILLLGIMMGSHHQSSTISTMVHKQWGNLLLGASFARGLTYVIMYLRPPRSVLPSRPPTELLTSFGLIAGGIVFMASVSERSHHM
ncbi:hypothetical protein QQS21_001894 [Conoideocrella luteorostrata]|uniref:Integral membrane protein n=1 Tax=Conoideocrella luteorostrata TaxID=1105319 RepID=A0AAJ0G1S7_9HYPO|nr:hypothetical protein QQS21_001894 [Conoideocrella luteorostrata]